MTPTGEFLSPLGFKIVCVCVFTDIRTYAVFIAGDVGTIRKGPCGSLWGIQSSKKEGLARWTQQN
jgi:hypothetical protein